jgi:hypothetical protein
MICCRPGPPTWRVGSAVRLLLTFLFSFLAWETALASSAEVTATASGGDAFDKDVVFSSPAEKAKVAGLARGLALREEDADSPPKQHRSLFSIDFTDSTTSAPLSAGNNNTVCGGLTDCINGCRSRFYKVTGGTGGPIFASTCRSVSFAQRLYVWKGGSSDCSTFTCTSTFAVCWGWGWSFASVLAQFSHVALTCATHSG